MIKNRFQPRFRMTFQATPDVVDTMREQLRAQVKELAWVLSVRARTGVPAYH